ncbi:Bug family tripartite tricarboxylate transporter substrate binding protein [Azohydromonas australica]|uniref:Bug family tripartite tricarboxylate transporter substrate binding protein n=1 Tax=Azohydromonas australica TaxID=364039 RepID=UPI0003FA1861|nr:tripartite tricarboxylate transporter substrate binding protein [Azohydromonas australica]
MDRRSLLTLLGLTLTTSVGSVFAQPSGRPVRVVVPLPAGSSNDHVARVLTPYMATTLGQTLVIDNKAGGNGTIGTLDVVRAAPDGLTLLLASNSPLAANVAFVKNMPYDPQRELTPIAGASLTNHVLMVKAGSPIRSLAEFIAYAKQRPGKVSVGYSTTSVQLQIATLSKMAGIEVLAVPYKGSPATITDVIGGALDATLTDPGNALAQVKGGQLRALAVSSLKRNPVTPDWPAISETLPGFDFPSWNVLMGPAGLPREIVNRLSNAVMQAQKRKDVVDKLAVAGTTPLIMGPDELKAFIDAETAKWVKLAREANIQPE